MLCPVCHAPNLDDAKFCASCGTPFAALEQPASDSIALAPRTPLREGAFVLEELLGEGGFGLTYRARESALSREVAIKEFFPYGSSRREGRVVPPFGVSEAEWHRELEAFREEALTLARFSHPAIVRAYAVWAQNGTAYFAMEFLRGQSLQKRLDEGYPLPTSEALQIVEHIGDALSRIHETGLLHRDIKPDNILLCPGRAVLIDFGTARSFAADQTTPMTQMLTPGYAPLEQYGRRARFGPFTDVYALAATLYHALSGQAPPPSPDRAAGVELRPLDELNPLIAPALARAVEAALEISVPKRPPTVAAWLEMLRGAVAPPAPVVPVPLPPAVPAPSVHTGTTTTTTQAPFTILPPDPEPSAGYTPPHPYVPPTPAVPEGLHPVATALPREARTPVWFWPLVFGVPILLLAFWLLHDPIRGDLRSYDSRLRPVFALSRTVQSSYTGANGPGSATLISSVRNQGLPAEQQVVATLRRMNVSSQEALYSRDQLLDAEQECLGALQSLAVGGDQNSAFQQLQHAARARAIWNNDYDFLMRQHRLR